MLAEGLLQQVADVQPVHRGGQAASSVHSAVRVPMLRDLQIVEPAIAAAVAVAVQLGLERLQPQREAFADAAAVALRVSLGAATVAAVHAQAHEAIQFQVETSDLLHVVHGAEHVFVLAPDVSYDKVLAVEAALALPVDLQREVQKTLRG